MKEVKLHARLGGKYRRVLCGGCGGELADVEEGRACVFFGNGMVENAEDGVFKRSEYAKSLAPWEEPRFRRSSNVPDGKAVRVAVLPVVAECPWCRCPQLLDPDELRVGSRYTEPDPSYFTGRLMRALDLEPEAEPGDPASRKKFRQSVRQYAAPIFGSSSSGETDDQVTLRSLRHVKANQK